MLRLISCIAISVTLSGCLIGPDLSKISPGMKKSEVIKALGKPRNVAVQKNVEYLEYEGEAGYADGKLGGKFYFVRLLDGVVESYGNKGDFNSTKNQTIDYNINQKTSGSVDQNITTTTKKDLYTELKKLQTMKEEGIITQDEFNSLKRKAIESSN